MDSIIVYIGVIIFGVIVYFMSTAGQRPVGINGRYSQEYKDWIAKWPSNPLKFVDWWNTGGDKGWTFMPRKNETPDEIFKSKIIDCGRITTLIMTKYGGKYRHIWQGFGKPHHAVWENTVGKKYWISFAGLRGKVCMKWEEIWTEYK